MFSISFKRNIELPLVTVERRQQYKEKSYVDLCISASYPIRNICLYVDFLLGDIKRKSNNYTFDFDMLRNVERFKETFTNIMNDGYKNFKEENTSYIVK